MPPYLNNQGAKQLYLHLSKRCGHCSEDSRTPYRSEINPYRFLTAFMIMVPQATLNTIVANPSAPQFSMDRMESQFGPDPKPGACWTVCLQHSRNFSRYIFFGVFRRPTKKGTSEYFSQANFIGTSFFICLHANIWLKRVQVKMMMLERAPLARWKYGQFEQLKYYTYNIVNRNCIWLG